MENNIAGHNVSNSNWLTDLMMVKEGLEKKIKELEKRIDTVKKMKNKVIIDILERLLDEIGQHELIPYAGHVDDDYITYVEGVIEGLKEDNTVFDVPNSSIDPNDWIIYTNTGNE